MPLDTLRRTAEHVNRLTYMMAAELNEEMSRSDGQPEKLDFRIGASCLNCCKNMSEQKPSVCSGCKSTVYCSRKCQVANWKVGQFGMSSHKSWCEKSKRYMLRVPQVKAILKLFPWGKIESDGTFAESITRACFGVFGARGYGYWSEAGGSLPHQLQPNTIDIHNQPFSTDPTKDYEDGYLLLHSRHLDNNTGWKLESKLIPQLYFEPGCELPIASTANVVDWKSWHQWRSLSFDSPAALLMHYPLTVYHLLVNILNVAHPSFGSSNCRQLLDVHYLGPEVELNMLPLFSELALLLPYTDIRLTFFGYAVHTIVQKANENSIAAKAKRDESVYVYRSPASMGQSTLAIYLDGDHEYWDPSCINNFPDAIVAPNAGLLIYKTWLSVILFCHAEKIPFGATEYTEQDAEAGSNWLSDIIQRAIPTLEAHMNVAQLEDFTRSRQYPIEFNPFQRPGQRPIGCIRLPNVSNGFTIRIIGKDSINRK